MNDIQQNGKERLHSLDVFRGMDMLCIVGLDSLMQMLPRFFPDSAVSLWFSIQFRHVKWEGYHLYDLIFPLFVFISGMAMSYSIGRRLEEGKGRWRLSADIVKRGLILVLLGMIYNGMLDFQFAQLRYPSVLGLIGISTTIGGLVAIWCRSWRQIACCGAAALVVTGSLQLFGGDFTPSGSINSWLDRNLLPGKVGVLDPEGILCVFSASFLAIGGYLTGLLIRYARFSSFKLMLCLLSAGAAMIGAGYALDGWIPIVKSLWTPSYTILACGWALAVFTILFLLIDLAKLGRFGFPFEVIGYNALAVYIGSRFIDFNYINKKIFTGFAGLFEHYAALVLAVTVLLIKWLILYFLWKHRIRIRIG